MADFWDVLSGVPHSSTRVLLNISRDEFVEPQVYRSLLALPTVSQTILPPSHRSLVHARLERIESRHGVLVTIHLRQPQRLRLKQTRKRIGLEIGMVTVSSNLCSVAMKLKVLELMWNARIIEVGNWYCLPAKQHLRLTLIVFSLDKCRAESSQAISSTTDNATSSPLPFSILVRQKQGSHWATNGAKKDAAAVRKSHFSFIAHAYSRCKHFPVTLTAPAAFMIRTPEAGLPSGDRLRVFLLGPLKVLSHKNGVASKRSSLHPLARIHAASSHLLHRPYCPSGFVSSLQGVGFPTPTIGTKTWKFKDTDLAYAHVNFGDVSLVARCEIYVWRARSGEGEGGESVAGPPVERVIMSYYAESRRAVWACFLHFLGRTSSLTHILTAHFSPGVLLGLYAFEVDKK
ncbi:hypothetical protein EDB85DRAFT_1895987 [Lactarius pseudohatsudake]|nr:hypothetical protein EDB85DRAFT_1895987 [Lactarius pseudohatsudake]